MADRQYLECFLHRLVTAWARHFTDQEEKRAVCRHVREQAECVRRLRERLAEFHGTTGHQSLLAVIRERQPLSNAETRPQHPFKPI